mmetsp:Transcript_78655/g.240701  ORF Transcript_78655/g.240701 Transcript_78655/m.240701 type:complete len:396 (+) Transcript_78655:377-1564(+)
MQWHPRLCRKPSWGKFCMAWQISARMRGTSASEQCSVWASTQSPSRSSSKMSMTVQNAASTTSLDFRFICSSRTTKGSPASAAANQKLYFMSFRCPWSSRIISAALSKAPPWSRSASRQDALTSAARPKVSTKFSAMSASDHGSVRKLSKIWRMAKSRSGTSPGPACTTSARTTAQTAAAHFRRHLTAGVGPSIFAFSASRSRSSPGRSLTSSRSAEASPVSAAMASRPPRMTALSVGALAMVCMTICKPASCPSATMARSSAGVPRPRRAIRCSTSGAPLSWKKARAFLTTPPLPKLARDVTAPAQTRANSSAPLPSSAARRKDRSSSWTPPLSASWARSRGSSRTKASMVKQHAFSTSSLCEQDWRICTMSLRRPDISGGKSLPLLFSSCANS